MLCLNGGFVACNAACVLFRCYEGQLASLYCLQLLAGVELGSSLSLLPSSCLVRSRVCSDFSQTHMSYVSSYPPPPSAPQPAID